MESFSFSLCPERENNAKTKSDRQYNPPAINAANKSPAPMNRNFPEDAGDCAGVGICPAVDCDRTGSCGADTAREEPLARGSERCEVEAMLSGGGSSAAIFLPDPESRFSRCNSARIS